MLANSEKAHYLHVRIALIANPLQKCEAYAQIGNAYPSYTEFMRVLIDRYPDCTFKILSENEHGERETGVFSFMPPTPPPSTVTTCELWTGNDGEEFVAEEYIHSNQTRPLPPGFLRYGKRTFQLWYCSADYRTARYEEVMP